MSKVIPNFEPERDPSDPGPVEPVDIEDDSDFQISHFSSETVDGDDYPDYDEELAIQKAEVRYERFIDGV